MYTVILRIIKDAIIERRNNSSSSSSGVRLRLRRRCGFLFCTPKVAGEVSVLIIGDYCLRWPMLRSKVVTTLISVEVHISSPSDRPTIHGSRTDTKAKMNVMITDLAWFSGWLGPTFGPRPFFLCVTNPQRRSLGL